MSGYLLLMSHAGEVLAEDSLFFDSLRQKRQTPPSDEFVPVFFSQLNITEEHRTICGDNQQCLFDIAASGDITLANTTLEHEEEYNKTVEIISMYIQFKINFYSKFQIFSLFQVIYLLKSQEILVCK